jgi:glycosyltransferase involved in cell wall biosynthesis
MKICVVIPGHNEEKYLSRVLKKVSKYSKNIIFIDDGSSDGSAKIAKKHTRHVLVHETNLGKGAALMTGCEYAFELLKADAVVFMDADDQHDPSHLPDFFYFLREYDIVLGVRVMGANMPLTRYLGNKLVSVLLNLLFGGYIADIPSGYKGLTRKAFDKVKWVSSGYEVETEIAVRMAQNKLKRKELEISAIYHDTDKGMTLLDGLHIATSLIQWRLGL